MCWGSQQGCGGRAQGAEGLFLSMSPMSFQFSAPTSGGCGLLARQRLQTLAANLSHTVLFLREPVSWWVTEDLGRKEAALERGDGDTERKKESFVLRKKEPQGSWHSVPPSTQGSTVPTVAINPLAR
jgi:hypothetical protein